MPYRHEHALRVRYAETDQMGVVYYGNYFIYFEIGRVELCRAVGLHYEQMEKSEGCFLTVAEAGCRYQKPLTYDTEFLIRTELQTFRASLLCFDYELVGSGSGPVLARGWTKHIVTGRDGRRRLIPEPYAGLLRAAL
jgi:acyl-CoA thioester hydrolase